MHRLPGRESTGAKIGLGVYTPSSPSTRAQRRLNRTRELEVFDPAPARSSPLRLGRRRTFELQVIVTDLEAFSQFSIKTLLNLPKM